MLEAKRSYRRAKELLKRSGVPFPAEAILNRVESNRARLNYRARDPVSRQSRPNFYNQRSIDDLVPSLAPIIYRYGKSLSGLKGKRILFLAGGHGELASFLNANFGTKAVVVDLDLSNIQIGMDGKLHEGVNAKADSLPFRDNSFDIVMSCHFLLSCYVPVLKAEQMIFREVSRVLKPKAYLVISMATPMAPGELQMEIRRHEGWVLSWQSGKINPLVDGGWNPAAPFYILRNKKTKGD